MTRTHKIFILAVRSSSVPRNINQPNLLIYYTVSWQTAMVNEYWGQLCLSGKTVDCPLITY